MNFKTNSAKIVIGIIIGFIISFLLSGFVCFGASYCNPNVGTFLTLYPFFFMIVYVIWSLFEKK